MSVQIVKCQCGITFAASAEPYCYEDKEWLFNLKKYYSIGCKIEMAENGSWSFGNCECDEGKFRRGEIKKRPIKNQLTIFNQ